MIFYPDLTGPDTKSSGVKISESGQTALTGFNTGK